VDSISEQPIQRAASPIRSDLIRRYREQRGLSLRAAAKLTGLSPSLLSQIERGITEPSISSLRKIAEALGVSIFYLIDESPESCSDEQQLERQVVRPAERRRVTLPHSGLRYELLCPDVSGRMEAWLGILEPGAATGEAARGHLSDEFMLVMSGTAELEYGDEKTVLEAEDSIYLDGTVAHRLRTVGDRPLCFLSVLSPPVL
jgi:transcriptional regulator with XRE-family HTH domain